MKKLSMVLAAFTLAVPAPIVFATPAQAGSNSYTNAYCKAISPSSGMSVGECNSLLTTGGHAAAGQSIGGFAAQICSEVLDNYPVNFSYAYASYTDCVQDGASQLINGQGSGGGLQ